MATWAYEPGRGGDAGGSVTRQKRQRVRRVWAAVSASPHASRRELMARLDMSHGAVSAALYTLQDAGYIAFERCASRAIVARVPFIEMRSR